jgi:K+-sensing histidine kinase KdpD
LFQVLSNLIGNAIKFTPRQGNIGISAMSNGEEIVFSVRDSGEGIAPEQLPHVFDRYWTQTENNPTGSGWGCISPKASYRPMAAGSWRKVSWGVAVNSALRCRK